MKEKGNRKSLKNEHKEEILELAGSFEWVDAFAEEFLALLEHKNSDAKFLGSMASQMSNLKKYGYKATLVFPRTLFEVLTGADGICSMHVNSLNHNYRILYKCHRDGTVLLLGFEEEEGKSNTDYTNRIPKAQRRLKEWSDNHD